MCNPNRSRPENLALLAKKTALNTLQRSFFWERRKRYTIETRDRENMFVVAIERDPVLDSGPSTRLSPNKKSVCETKTSYEVMIMHRVIREMLGVDVSHV